MIYESKNNILKNKIRLLTAVTLFLGVNQFTAAHGTITDPPSRVYGCYKENPESPKSDACKAAVATSGSQGFYDWNGVRQGNANDNHRDVINDGELCSGGNPDGFGGLDLARSDWPAVDVNSGSFTFNWSNTAAHATAYTDYYITQENFDVTSPLHWNDLEFLCRNDATGPETSSSHTCTLPERTGKHIVYSIWQRSDSPEAFYACVDVSYDSTTTPPTGNQAPVANINGPYNVAIGSAIRFSSNGSSDSDGSIASYEWIFGDGNSSSQANPEHTYATPGSFNVQLVVTDNENKSTSSTIIAQVNEVGAPSDCAEPQHVGGTRYNNGDIVQNVGKKFECKVGGWCSSSADWAYEPGVGLYWEQAWQEAGACSTDDTTDNTAPTASVNGPYSSEINNVINFTSTGSNDTDGTIASYNWAFGDGQTSTQANPAHTYTNVGSYTVSLTVTDNQGASNTAVSRAIITDTDINQVPVAKANGPYQVVLGNGVQFNSNGSYDPDGSITYYLWEFGDGNSSSASQPNHTYNSVGTFNVTLTVTDNEGDSNSSNATVNVTQEPVDSDSIVLGYFVQWGVYQRNYHVNNIKTSGSADKLTHINYAFGNVKNGRCVVGDAYADFEKAYNAGQSVDGTADKWNDPLKGNFNQLKKLKAMYPNIKVLWSFGGWSWSGGFTQAAQNPEAFADSCFDLIHDPRWDGLFDGIDIDWEYPNTCGLTCDNSGPNAFSTLMSALRDRFGSELVTAAVPAGKNTIAATDYGSAAQYADWYNVMTYDLFGAWEKTGPTAPHSPLRDYNNIPIVGNNSDSALNAYIEQGVPVNKLLLGIGFYGRGWTGVTQNAPGGSATGPASGVYESGIQDYKVLKDTCPITGTVGGTSYAKCGSNWWSYDSPADVANKMTYVKNKNLGGTFFWELSGDTADGELIEAMKNNL